jgi:hypothetical protein
MIRWLLDHLLPVPTSRILAAGQAVYEAGRQMGIAEERFRLLQASGQLGPVELAACRAALDQAVKAGDDLGRLAE